MPTIAAMCSAAKLQRPNYNTLIASGRTASWGDPQSEGFAIRIGLYSAFKAVGLLTPEAVDYADTLAGKDKLPKWFIRNPLDNEEQFHSSDKFEQISIGSLLGLVDAEPGEWLDENEPVQQSFAPPSQALVVINLHSVRDRMLALFK